MLRSEYIYILKDGSLCLKKLCPGTEDTLPFSRNGTVLEHRGSGAVYFILGSFDLHPKELQLEFHGEYQQKEA